MSFDDLDPTRTIVAIASPMGAAIRGIIRLSGPQTWVCLKSISDPAIDCPQAAHSFSTTIRVHGISRPIPAQILLWPENRSYTRQLSAEVHTVGSPAMLESIVESLCRNGAALARPGEFTLRAFLAGRLDLSQAEAVIAAVEATSETEFGLALAQSAGGIRNPLEHLRRDLLEVLAHVEAGLDFVEDDIQFISRPALESKLTQAQASLQELCDQLGMRNLSSGGWRIALIGRPNAGKSSLFNALVGRPAAIATAIAGTTRDYLEESVAMGGFAIRLIDTAGLGPDAGEQNPRDSESSADSMGATDSSVVSLNILAQRRAREVIERSHLLLLCVDQGIGSDDAESLGWQGFEGRILRVATKVDLGIDPQKMNRSAIPVSARNGEGINVLRSTVGDRLRELSDRAASASPTIVRCSESLARSGAALARALDCVQEHRGDEIVSAELRGALEELGRIVGVVYTDEILGQIFSRFCIGK